jgi:translocation and assembly module TamB
MTRRLRITLMVAAVPVLGGLLWEALLTVGNTVWGRQHIESLVADLTGNNVRLHGLGGELPYRPTLQKLELADARGIWLTAQNLEAVWQPWALLQKRVAVQSAHAQRIDWSRLPIAHSHKSRQPSIPDIDVHEATADAVNVSAALAGTAATLNLHASAHLRSLSDMQLAFAATRLDGAGTYSLQLAFDRTRMDGAFRLREPGHGPLAGLAGVPAVGDVVVSGDLAGPRQAEHINLHADLGELHAQATGVVDLVHASANLEYAADATAMTPRPDLAWQQLHVKGNWQGTLATAVAAGEVQAQGLQLPGDVRIAALNASLRAHGGDLSVQGRMEGATAPGLPSGLFASAPLVAEGSIQLAQATRPFELRVSHPSLNMQAKGQAAGKPAVDADLDTPNVAALLRASPLGLSGPLRLHVRAERDGGGAKLRVTASGDLAATAPALQGWLRGPETADIRATYQPAGLTITDAVVADKVLSVAGSGRLSAPSSADAPWNVAAKTRATLADLSILLPSLSGQASVRAELSGNTAALRTSGDVQATLAVHGSMPGTVAATFKVDGLPHAPQAEVSLRGSLAAQPVSLQAQVQVHPGESVHIELPQADWRTLHAQGNLTLAWQDLDRSQGQFKWSIADLSDLNQLLGQHFAGALAGALNLVPGKDGAVASTSLQVSGEGLQIGSQKFSATLTGSGPLHALQLNLAAQAPLLGKPASLMAQGQLQVSQHTVTVTSANATVHAVDLKLEQPALVDFTQGLRVSGLHISAADAHLQAAGEVLPQLRVDAELKDATPGLIDAILPGYLDSGTLQASLKLQGTVAHPLGQLRVTGTDLRAPGDAGSLPPVELAATADLANDGVKISLHSSAGDATHMSIEGSIPWSAPLAVTVTGNVDLARFNPVLESIGRRISGKIDVNAQVAGTLDVPTVKGTVQLHNGTIHDYRHGVDLTDIEGLLEGTQSELRITQLTGHAATGTIAVTGTLGVLQGGWPVDLKLTARNAQPFASSIVSGTVNADLTLTGTALHELTLAGSVLVNRATVEIPNSFPPNVAVLDVRRPGQVVTPPAANGPVININVSVNAPRQILVRGRGLDAELGGSLKIGGNFKTPTIDGGFDLQRGLFNLAGSRLNFSSGRVSFTGTDITGKIDPTLDFTAQTTTVDTTVTLHITGVADAPQFELTSVPQLPQDEILARLLFGESAGQLTALQAAQIGAAVVTLTGVGTGLNPLVEIQKHLGLDRLSVGSNDTGVPGSTQNNGATIEAGRYVTSRIFVDVKQNTTGATQLQVAVDLTSKLKLQTQVGTGTATVQGTTPDNDPGSSVGLSYRFEY